MDYSCVCGRSFEKANSLNAHYSHCLVHRGGIPGIDRFDKRRGWAKGLTKETDERVRKFSITLTGKKYFWTKERREDLSRKMKGKSGGYRENTNRWKGFYVNLGEDKIWLDSTYELRFVNVLNRFNIKWIKNNKKFPYIFKGITYNYIPDFYIPELDVWVETKGWLKESDPFKWQYFPYKLRVLFKDNLRELEKAKEKEKIIDILLDNENI